MDTIAQKIQKLLAHADSTTHPQEADAFLAKAHALLEQHGLNLLDIGKLGSDDPLGDTPAAAVYTPIESSFRDVVFAACRLYGCRGVLFVRTRTVDGKRVKRYEMTAYGRESARVTVTLMWPYVKRRMVQEARKLRKADGDAHSVSVYMRHVAVALERRIWDMIASTESSAAKQGRATNGANALVPVDLIEQLLPSNCKAVRSVRKDTTAGAVKAASGINLNRQTAGTAHKRIAG